MLLPSDKLLREQARLHQLQASQERRKKQLEQMLPGFARQNLINQRRKEYEDFYKKTKKVSSVLDQLSFLSYVAPIVTSHLGKVGEILDNFLTGAYAVSKPLRTLRKIKRSQYERLLEKELGISGKITRSFDILSNISLLTYTYPKVLNVALGTQLHPLRVSTLVSKGLLHGTNLGIGTLNALFGTSLPKIPTSGFAGMLGFAPYMALAVGASIMKSRKLARLQVRRQPGAAVEKEHSLSGTILPYITRLAVEGQLTPRDQLELQLLQWIESHTSVIPTIYEELDIIAQSKEKGGAQAEELTKVKKPQESLLTRIENAVNATILKYDPITQLINFITSRRLPKDALQDLFGSAALKEHWEEIDRLSKTLGIGRSQAQLLSTPSSQIITTVPTYEAKILSLQTGIYDLLRLSVSELATIRGHGFGISENLVHKREVTEEKSIFGRMLDAIKSIPEKIVSLPGVHALWNITKLPFTLPKKAYEFAKSLEESLFLGKGFVEFIKSPEKVLKEAGLYIPEQELAYKFLGKKLPIAIEDVRRVEVEQLEVEQNMYVVLREMLKHIAGIDISYRETQRQLKQRRMWSTTLGTYLSEGDYQRRRQYEEQLIKQTLVKQFEKKSLLGRLRLFGIPQHRIEERYAKVRQFLAQRPEQEAFEFLQYGLEPQLAEALSGSAVSSFIPLQQEFEGGGLLDKLKEKLVSAKLRALGSVPLLASGVGALLASGSSLLSPATALLPVLGTLLGAKVYEWYKGRQSPELERWVASSGQAGNVISLQEFRRRKYGQYPALPIPADQLQVAVAGGYGSYLGARSPKVISMAERLQEMKHNVEYKKWDKFRSGVLDLLEKISDNVTTGADVTTGEVEGSGTGGVLSSLFGLAKGLLGKARSLLSLGGGAAVGATLPMLMRYGRRLPRLFSRGLALGGRFGGRILSKAALPLTALMSIYDAFKGWTGAGEAFDTSHPTLGMKVASAAGRVLSLGFSDKKVAQWLYNIFGSDIFSSAIHVLKDYTLKIIHFPKLLIDKFEELTHGIVDKFKENVSESFKWVVSLPTKLVNSIKEYLKGTFVGKIFTKIFGSNELEESGIPHAAFGGLFLKQTITHIAEGNRPELVLPLEHPKTTELLHEYVNKYVEKTVSKAHGHVRALVHGYHNISKHLDAAKRVKDRIDDVIRNAKDITNQVSHVKLAKAVAQATTAPILAAVQQPVTSQTVTREPRIEDDYADLRFDFMIEKHLNDIFRNTIIALEKSFEDYIYGGLEFNLI